MHRVPNPNLCPARCSSSLKATDLLVLRSWMPIDTFLADGQRLSAALGVTDVVSAIAIPAPTPGDVFWSHKARADHWYLLSCQNPVIQSAID